MRLQPKDPDRGKIVVGISGYDYKPWRGVFYPEDLPARRWLEYASRKFSSVEINGTFYSLKSPAVFRRWMREVDNPDFIFAIKGSRFITHNLKLRRVEAALGNFFASGILALGKMTGPFLWQLPATYRFDADRMEMFMGILPMNSREAEAVAEGHDERVRSPLTEAAETVDYRHCFEVRHESYFCKEFYDLLSTYGHGFVIADSAGKFPYAEVVTSDFVYVRLHGSEQLYASRYSDTELDDWAAKIRGWTAGKNARDVYLYFDNDAKVHAPRDALRLVDRLQ
jgi:uncharacterized protein YecE (DUF72 family)